MLYLIELRCLNKWHAICVPDFDFSKVINDVATHCMHNLPFGAEIIAPGLTRFRLWAPDKQNIELVIEGRSPIAMQRNDSGLFESEVDCGEGTRYRFHVGDRLLVPDPASRLQSGDVHDPS